MVEDRHLGPGRCIRGLGPKGVGIMSFFIVMSRVEYPSDPSNLLYILCDSYPGPYIIYEVFTIDSRNSSLIGGDL